MGDFYRRYGFDDVANQPMALYLKMATAAETVRAALGVDHPV